MRRIFAIQQRLLLAFARVPLLWMLAGVVVLSFWERYDALEGAWFPVAQVLSIDRVEVINGSQRVEFSFAKHRDCEFKSVNWYWEGDAGELIPVPYSVDPEFVPSHDRTRPTGSSASAHILQINTGIDRLRGFVRHVCHPLWDTRTQFYP